MVHSRSARAFVAELDCVLEPDDGGPCVGACRRFAYTLWRKAAASRRDTFSGLRCPLKRMSHWESDLSLARRVTAGDARAIEEFAERMQCVPLIVASLNARRGRPLAPSDMHDLSQDVFVLLWKKLPAFEGMSTLESWVFRFCHYEFLNTLRRRRRGNERVDLEERDLESATPERIDGTLEYSALHRTLERLAPREAAAIRAKHFDGLTFEEIGARLGVPPNTAKTHYYRGIERMRLLLRPTEDESK